MEALIKKSLIGTETERRLANSYANESMAYSRYTFFASVAEKEGYFQYAEIFRETAANELAHAKLFFKLLKEGDCRTTPLDIDAGVIGTTLENLRVAAHEEEMEGVEKYLTNGGIAENEGFPDIAEQFRAVATIENHHKERYEKMIRHIADGTVWKREKSVKWLCMVCGYIHEGTEPPKICPACLHPFQHFSTDI